MIIFSVQYTLFERVNLTLMVARSSPIFSFDFAVLLYCVDRPRDVNHAHLYSLQERTRQKTIESARYLHTYITTITTTTTTITAYTAAFPQSRSSSAGIRVISASDIGNAGGWCTVNRSPEHPHSADFVLIYGWSFSKQIVKPFFFSPTNSPSHIGCVMLLYLFYLILLFTLLFSLFFFSVEEGTQATSSGSVSPVAVAVPVIIALLIILGLVGFFVWRRYTAFCLLGDARCGELARQFNLKLGCAKKPK